MEGHGTPTFFCDLRPVWAWNRTADYSNTENVGDGENSMKFTYTVQCCEIKFANSSPASANDTEFEGMAGLKLVLEWGWWRYEYGRSKLGYK